MMTVSTILVLLVIASIHISSISAATNKFACYYGSWSIGDGIFKIEDIDANVCTHVIYSFAGIDEQGTITFDEDIGITQESISKFVKLKERNPNLKVMVAVGGWLEGSVKYSNMVSTPESRTRFTNSTVDFLTKYGFDGIDIDWEQPGEYGGKPEDKQNFATLISEMRARFDAQDGKKYLLSAAVAATAYSVQLSYDVKSLARDLDWVSLMTYDLHSNRGNLTGQNSPLYASSAGPAEDKTRNLDAAVQLWLANGAMPDKLVIGIGIYGQSYTLKDNANHGVGVPTSGPGKKGPHSGEAGILEYNEICVMLKGEAWKTVWDDEQKVPYSYNENQWVGYDNDKSVKLKVDYAKQKKLAGVMTWSITTDDYQGLCGRKYPLLNSIKEQLAV